MYDYTFIADVATGKTTELGQLMWAGLILPSRETPLEPLYTDKEIQAVELDLMRFRTMAPADADVVAREEYGKLQQEYQETNQRWTSERERLIEMQRKVQAWDAPGLCQDVKRRMLALLQTAIADVESALIRCQRWSRDLRCSGGEQYREFKIKDLAHHLDRMRADNRQRLEEHRRGLELRQALERSLGPRK